MRIIFLVLTISVLALSSKTAFASNILLNEIMANPISGEKEWVEIYNSSSENIDLNGWNLQERTSSGTFNTYALPNVVLQTKALCFYEFSTAKLNNDSDTVNLLDNTGTLQDTYSYTSTTQGQSFARIPDGGDWNTNVIPTKDSICSSLLAPTTPPASPTPNSSPTPTSSNSPSSSLFTISDVPSQINSDESFNVSITLSLPDNPNTNFYLKGAFKKTNSSNYFGLTKVGTDWIKNSSTYTNQFKITTDSSGNWSDSMEVKADPDDKGYTGTDDYIFKVGKYNSADSSPSISWSDNESIIKIIFTESDEGATSTNDPSPTTAPESAPSSTKTKTSSPNRPKSYDTLVYHSASVAGAKASANASTSALPEVSVKNQKQINPIIWIGLVLILIGVGSLGYIYLKKNVKIPF